MHDSLRPFAIPALSLRRKNQRNLFFVTGIGANFRCGGSTVFTAVDTGKSGLTAAFLPPSAIYIERAKPPPADPDGGRFREYNQKGATNLFYHRTGPVSFVGFTNLYGL
jgi:hypothetical protein